MADGRPGLQSARQGWDSSAAPRGRSQPRRQGPGEDGAQEEVAVSGPGARGEGRAGGARGGARGEGRGEGRAGGAWGEGRGEGRTAPAARPTRPLERAAPFAAPAPDPSLVACSPEIIAAHKPLPAPLVTGRLGEASHSCTRPSGSFSMATGGGGGETPPWPARRWRRTPTEAPSPSSPWGLRGCGPPVIRRAAGQGRHFSAEACAPAWGVRLNLQAVYRACEGPPRGPLPSFTDQAAASSRVRLSEDGQCWGRGSWCPPWGLQGGSLHVAAAGRWAGGSHPWTLPAHGRTSCSG